MKKQTQKRKVSNCSLEKETSMKKATKIETMNLPNLKMPTLKNRASQTLRIAAKRRKSIASILNTLSSSKELPHPISSRAPQSSNAQLVEETTRVPKHVVPQSRTKKTPAANANTMQVPLRRSVRRQQMPSVPQSSRITELTESNHSGDGSGEDDDLNSNVDGEEAHDEEAINNQREEAIENGVEDAHKHQEKDAENFEDGDINASSAAMELNENIGTTKRNPRGLTRCLGLVGLDRKIKVELNKYNQPVGPNPYIKSLGSKIGTIARNPSIVPLNKKNWHEVSDEVKETIWKLVTKIFDIPEEGKKWVLATASESWKCNKSRLKKNYYTVKDNYQDKLDNIPPNVPQSQWAALVSYWSDPKIIDTAKNNARSSKMRKNMHKAGSKSFARIAHAEYVRTGEEPSLIEMYKMTRKNKDDKLCVDEKTQEELDKISDNDPQADENFLSKQFVKQRNGRAILRGRAVAPSDIKRKKIEEEIRKDAKKETDNVWANMRKMEARLSSTIQHLVSVIKNTNPNIDLSLLDPLGRLDDDGVVVGVTCNNSILPDDEETDADYVADDCEETDNESVEADEDIWIDILDEREADGYESGDHDA